MHNSDGVGATAYATSEETPLTIGLLTYGARDTIASDKWSAVSDVARQHGGKALCFPAGSPKDQPRSGATSAVVFDQAGSENSER
jgi:hypothetical protein